MGEKPCFALTVPSDANGTPSKHKLWCRQVSCAARLTTLKAPLSITSAGIFLENTCWETILCEAEGPSWHTGQKTWLSGTSKTADGEWKGSREHFLSKAGSDIPGDCPAWPPKGAPSFPMEPQCPRHLADVTRFYRDTNSRVVLEFLVLLLYCCLDHLSDVLIQHCVTVPEDLRTEISS